MLVQSPFVADDWLFEIKHDDFRSILIRDGARPRLYTRNDYDLDGR